ncbi:MAG TPA: KH domain-containing protein [Candidatus Limnocylindria bacterium]|nr:KH domain-containing protein [Candidatus Limnocylindria bacterium]
MQAFVEFVVKGLVDQPDAVEVTPVEKNGLTVYELRVAPDDAGKIIGRRGATIQAIRSLVQVGAQKRGIRCTLDLVED